MSLKFDIDQIILDYDMVRMRCLGLPNPDPRQICLTRHRSEDQRAGPYGLGVGSLSQGKTRPYHEAEFTHFNELFQDLYLYDVWKRVKAEYDNDQYGIGRVRFMTLPPGDRYSFHRDPSQRIHIAVQTDYRCFLMRCRNHDMMEGLGAAPDGLAPWDVFHYPADGRPYLLDTTRPHTALNLSETPRTHMVFSMFERT